MKIEEVLDEVVNTWSQLAYLTFDHLNPTVRARVSQVYPHADHHRHSHVRSQTWAFNDLNFTTQLDVLGQVNEDYPDIDHSAWLDAWTHAFAQAIEGE